QWVSFRSAATRHDVFCMAEYFLSETDTGALTLALHLKDWLLTLSAPSEY
ncbi:MAG: hypothetical protein RL707_1610, partial [Pseudomonadota bacterium]